MEHTYRLALKAFLGFIGMGAQATNEPLGRPSDLFMKLVVAACLVTTVLYRLTTTVADTDLWGYLSFGRLFWDKGQFPYQDVFSFVPTLDPWVYHEWLTGVLFYPLYQSLGAPGLQLLKYALGLTTLGLIYLTARKRGAAPLSAACGVFFIHGLMRMAYSPVRAQLFTYFFFALTFYLLESTKECGRRSSLWWLVPIQVLWANLHGGFLAGLGLMGIYSLGETLSRRPCRFYWLVLLLAGLATLINPYGLAYWKYIIQAVSMPRPEITEWASVFDLYKSGSPRGPLVYFLILNIFAVLYWARHRRFTEGLALAFTMYLGWKHQRHQVFFLILMGAYLPGLLSAYLNDLKSRHQFMSAIHRLGWRIPVALGLFIVVLNTYKIFRQDPLTLKIPPLPGVETETPTYYPLGAIDYLRKEQLKGKLVVHFNWGEYLIWTLYPQCLVALDGRFETVYPEAVAKDYFDFIYGRDNWRKFIDNNSPDLVLIDCRTKIYTYLRQEKEWRQVYVDAGCALFRRQNN